MSRQILSGWKEISRHIGRSVRTIQRRESWLGVPVYRPAQKDRSAVLAFYDELERWISRPSPVREEDAVLNSEIVLQVLKDMAGLVGKGSEPSSQMRLWPEPLPQPIEFYHPRSASRTLPARPPWRSEARASCWPSGPGRLRRILTARFSKQRFDEG
jgi:hypothetical protein